MTKKHFEAFAYRIKAGPWKTKAVRLQAMDMVADVCQQFNGRFDRERFLDACEPTHPGRVGRT